MSKAVPTKWSPPGQLDPVSGSGGGKTGGGGTVSTPHEAANNLKCNAQARIIDLLGEGSVAGLVNGGQGILLDGTPLYDADGKPNFKGVTWQQRLGYPDQAPMDGFDEVESEVSVNIQVTHAIPVVRTIETGDFDHLKITLNVPALMIQQTNDGDIVGTGVRVEIFVSPAGAGNWTKASEFYIVGKSNRPYQESIILRNMKTYYGSGPWDVKLSRATADATTSNLQNETWWQSFGTILNERLSYPDCNLVGIEIDAKQFGSQIPTRSYLLKARNDLMVPSNYNTSTRAYAGIWDGTFKLAWTDNPAWIFYDICVHNRLGLGDWIKAVNLDKWALYSIGQYCDGLVDNGLGGKEPRYTFNYTFQTQEEAISVLNAMAGAFCAMPFWGSNIITMSQDSPKDPVKLATPANVTDGKFDYAGSALRSRSSVVFVTWNDPQDHFKPAIEVVEDPELIAKFGWNKKDVLATGCTKRSQARRFGRWVLDSEKNQQEVACFRGGFDWIDALPGDIVKVADPSYAGVRFGGRLKGGPDSPENLFKYSNDFSQSVWTRTEIALGGAGDNSGPLPNTIATRITDDAVNNTHRFYQNLTKTPEAKTYTLSAYVKAETITRCMLRLGGNVSSNVDEVYFNLGNGVVSGHNTPGNFTNVGSSITPVGSGWYRISITSTSNADTVLRGHLFLANSVGNVTYVGTGQSLLAYGLQVECRAAPSDYVETTAAPHDSVISTTNLPLDAPVTLQSGQTYTLSVVLPDMTVADKPVTTPAGTHMALTVSPALSQVPVAEAVWILSGSNVAPRQFRILSNTEPERGKCEIIALEHDPTKYARIEQNLNLAETPTSLLPAGPTLPPANLDAKLFTYQDGRNFSTGVLLSWDYSNDPRVDYYEVDHLLQDGSWINIATTQDPSAEKRGLRPGIYNFRVRGRGLVTSSWTVLENVAVADPNYPPPDITGLEVKGGGTTYNGKDAEFEWDSPANTDYFPLSRLQDYRVQILDTNGVVKRTNYVTTERFVYGAGMVIHDFTTAPRSFNVSVAARDVTLRLSAHPAVITVTKSVPSMASYAPTAVQSHTGVAVSFASAPVDTQNVAGFKVYMDETADPATLVATVASEARDVFVRHNMATVVNPLRVKVVPFDNAGDGVASSVASHTVNKAFYIDADNGKAYAGDGDVIIDDTGIAFSNEPYASGPPPANTLKWGPVVDGELASIDSELYSWTVDLGGGLAYSDTYLVNKGDVQNKDSWLSLYSVSPADTVPHPHEAHLLIMCSNGTPYSNSQLAFIQMDCGGGLGETMTFQADQFGFLGGLAIVNSSYGDILPADGEAYIEQAVMLGQVSAAPAAPGSGLSRFYSKSTGFFYKLGSGGEVQVGDVVSGGKSGGQTLKGGTTAGNNLTLMSTNHATKGKILLGTSAYDEVNNRLGIGNAAPAYPLDVTGDANVSTGSKFKINGVEHMHYALPVVATVLTTPANGETRYCGCFGLAPQLAANLAQIFVPRAGAIKAVYIRWRAGTAGTGESVSLYVRLNNTTDTLIATIGDTSAVKVFSNTSLNIAVAASDTIEIKMIFPAWVTPPTSVSLGGTIFVEV